MTPTPRRFHRLKAVLERRQPDLTVIMDQVNKGHNFSAVLRNCDAVGVQEAHAIPPDRGRFDLFHHTSAGTAKWVRVTPHPTVEDAIATLQGRGFQVVAAHLSEKARDFRTVDFTRPTAILVGAELEGVSAGALERVDAEVVIPMQGMVQSLNVSVATALLLFEAMRQREAAGMYATSRLPEEEFRNTLFRWAHPRLAGWYDQRQLPYPALDGDGRPLEPLPAGPHGEVEDP
jgi:tRNA (guanosine-2'-O-)-methyltransferase